LLTKGRVILRSAGRRVHAVTAGPVKVVVVERAAVVKLDDGLGVVGLRMSVGAMGLRGANASLELLDVK
jgi:hypothetical protein